MHIYRSFASTLHFFFPLQSIFCHCTASVSASVFSHMVRAFPAFSIDPQPEWEQNKDDRVTGWDSYRLTPVCCCWRWMTTDMQIRKDGLKKDTRLSSLPQNKAIDRNGLPWYLKDFFPDWNDRQNSQTLSLFHLTSHSASTINMGWG